MSNVQALPGVFPLHEDRNFISESEWVIFKLLCKPVDTFTEEDAEALSKATGNQVPVARCDELIRIVRISKLNGLGSWISRLFAEAGFNDSDVRNQDADTIIEGVNTKVRYPICNKATARALHTLQLQWKGTSAPSTENVNAKDDLS
ncbi:MAG: hypothetical protein Q9M17_04260 [Mariprofundus sp.]|nr:hypothetical protein [Mariprofundus sp.]